MVFLVVVNARESGDADIGCMRAWGLFQRPTCHPNRLIVAQTDFLVLPRAVQAHLLTWWCSACTSDNVLLGDFSSIVRIWN